MPVIDTGPHRTSACPVHFLWDGRGLGRPLVRASFMGLSISGAVATLGWMTRSDDTVMAAAMLAGVAGLGWTLGQLFSAVAARRSLAR
jgi:hypothetical protein